MIVTVSYKIILKTSKFHILALLQFAGMIIIKLFSTSFYEVTSYKEKGILVHCQEMIVF